jgi:asparagine synthase (glutamine-hydrolysing)
MNQKEELKNVLTKAIKEGVNRHKKVALALSGGIDSSVIAKILQDLGINFTAYSVSFEKENSDIKIAEKLANDMKINFKKIVFIGDYEGLVSDLIRITKRHDSITIGVGMPLLVICQQAKHDNADLILTGLGSDETLAGYDSHAKALENGFKAVDIECKKRVKEVSRDVERDKAICENYKIAVSTPFLDENVINIALSIPPEQKISKNEKKIVLREIAKELGLPDYVYNRPKKAAQYGSGSQKILKKLSNEKGFRTTDGYLMSVYKQVYKK